MWQDFIHRFAVHAPDRVAIVDRVSDRSLSYAELDSEVNLWARYLYAQGVGRGDRVAYLAPNRLEHLTLFFACSRLGAILAPLNNRLSPRELSEIISRVEPTCFLGEGAAPFKSAIGYQPVADVLLGAENVDLPHIAVPDNTPLLMLFTSGTTGRPKGVLFHAGMLMANMHYTVSSGVLEPNDISIVNTPFFHTGGYNVFTLPLLSIGGTLILFEKFDPGKILAAIHQDRVNVFWGVPTMFQAIYEHPNFTRTDFSRIRFFLSGGAPLSLSLIQAYHHHGIPFKQGFGLTEVGPNCFLHETQDAFNRPDSIGKPMPHSLVKVENKEGQAVAPNEIGALLIAGPHVCKGYWREKKRFEAVLKEGFFATGDLVRVDEEGFFFVVGREKDMYISGGENVYPGEVEKQLVAHPNIHQAVVVSVKDEKWGEVGFAFVVGIADPGLEKIRAYLDPLLARYKHPHYVHPIETMPMLANGKTDRRLLEKEAARITGDDNPRTWQGIAQDKGIFGERTNQKIS